MPREERGDGLGAREKGNGGEVRRGMTEGGGGKREDKGRVQKSR